MTIQSKWEVDIPTTQDTKKATENEPTKKAKKVISSKKNKSFTASNSNKSIAETIQSIDKVLNKLNAHSSFNEDGTYIPNKSFIVSEQSLDLSNLGEFLNSPDKTFVDFLKSKISDSLLNYQPNGEIPFPKTPQNFDDDPFVKMTEAAEKQIELLGISKEGLLSIEISVDPKDPDIRHVVMVKKINNGDTLF